MRLQAERLRAARDEVEAPSQRWSDAQFFIVAANRFKHSVELATSFEGFQSSETLVVAMKVFDAAAPNLKNMRDVGEHVEGYGSGRGHNEAVRDVDIHSAVVTGTSFKWIGLEVKYSAVISAAAEVVETLLQEGNEGDGPNIIGSVTVTGTAPHFTYTHTIGSRK